MVEISLECAIEGQVGSFNVTIDDGKKISVLKDAIKDKKPNKLKNVDADELELSLAKKGEDWLPIEDLRAIRKGEDVPGFERVSLVDTDDEEYSAYSIQKMLQMKGLRSPQTEQIHVLVVVPPPSVGSKRSADEIADVQKRLRLLETDSAAIKPALAAIKPKTLTKFTPLSVHEDEFQLDSLSITQQSDDPIVITPTLHEFWEGFGEFPPHYFVRVEEVMFWEVIKKMLYGEDRVVIVGSPGVGKSCFLMLIAFYLACIKMEKVLVIRRLKEPTLKNAVVFFDGQGSYARLTNLSQIDIRAIRHQVSSELVDGKFDKKEVPIVLVDGFNQAQVDDSNSEYGPFRLLATSCQFDAKQDDSSRIVVLPAWRDADLLQYAKSTNWVTETGLRQIKRQDTPFPRLVKEQYFYSGGSLREFCRNRRSLLERVTSDCCAVANDQAFELVYNYGGGQSRSQVDRIRRHFITDATEKWITMTLGRKIDTDKQLEVYKYAKSVGAGFHGVAYEQLLHNAVRGAFVKRKPVVLKMREGSIYEKIEIRVPNVVCSGKMRNRVIVA
ncbi:putative P-loop containing nucleoside triphosphate hydrolase [Plasmopara halstedii]